MSIDFEKFKEEYNKEHSIICPYCDLKQDNETLCNHVSYWGDGDDKECFCDDCGKKFFVEEVVDRTFIEKKIEE